MLQAMPIQFPVKTVRKMYLQAMAYDRVIHDSNQARECRRGLTSVEYTECSEKLEKRGPQGSLLVLNTQQLVAVQSQFFV